MVRDATDLAERIKRLDKTAKVDVILALMQDYNISTGDIIERSNVNVVRSDADRLREINQVRKKARKAKQLQQENIVKAQVAKKEKRERLVKAAEVAKERPPIVVAKSDDEN